MRYPEFLSEGGKIGFVAPAFGAGTEPYLSAFKNACLKFENEAHKLVLGPNCYKNEGVGISASPKECGRELTDFYLSKDCDVLISMGGGELMCETMDYVDFDQIKKAPPKLFQGYSDNTNFIFLLNTLCDTAAIYGPNAPAFGMETWHDAIVDSYELLRGNKLSVSNYSGWEKESKKDESNPLEAYNITEQFELKTYNCSAKDSFSGRLIGGCLDCLSNIVGTKYDNVKAFIERYKDDGIVWFLESCDLNVFSVRRALWQLDRSGWFENVKGFIFGRPYSFGQNMFGLDHYKAVADILFSKNVPIIMDADIGHLPPMMPVLSGAYANIFVDSMKLKLEYELK